MFAAVSSATLVGVEARPVTVEVDTGPGMQTFQLVGLPEGAVREARVRVRAAFDNAQLTWPSGRLSLNLAPADIRKDGTLFDLPIALAVLWATRQLSGRAIGRLREYVVAGELSLEGELRPIRGALSLALCAREQGMRGVILPLGNAEEAALVPELEVIGCETLLDAWRFVRGEDGCPEPWARDAAGAAGAADDWPFDLSEVRGQPFARRALEIAAAGGHNLLMVGAPGSGKTMLARRLVSVLPLMTFEESLETTRVHSVCGLTRPGAGVTRLRPFRAPHHTISEVGMVGGGAGIPRPGEVSLAHNGVLFLDELPEFRRTVLEVLRQPLEDGVVNVVRSQASITYPAAVTLVASMNPCPCGHLGDVRTSCRCTLHDVQRYRGRISGPILDRIDLHVEVPSVPYDQLRGDSGGETSAVVRARVQEARDRQAQRLAPWRLGSNARMGARELQATCELDGAAHRLLERAVSQLGMSARAWSRVIKVGRTIADLAGEERIRACHVAEAIQLRTLDRRLDNLPSSAERSVC